MTTPAPAKYRVEIAVPQASGFMSTYESYETDEGYRVYYEIEVLKEDPTIVSDTEVQYEDSFLMALDVVRTIVAQTPDDRVVRFTVAEGGGLNFIATGWMRPVEAADTLLTRSEH